MDNKLLALINIVDMGNKMKLLKNLFFGITFSLGFGSHVFANDFSGKYESRDSDGLSVITRINAI